MESGIGSVFLELAELVRVILFICLVRFIVHCIVYTVTDLKSGLMRSHGFSLNEDLDWAMLMTDIKQIYRKW